MEIRPDLINYRLPNRPLKKKKHFTTAFNISAIIIVLIIILILFIRYNSSFDDHSYDINIIKKKIINTEPFEYINTLKYTRNI